MTTTTSQTPLTTLTTVDRSLVHRAALSEVLLTGFRSLGEESFAGAAQLPPAHAYYGDHTTEPAVHDPLAVFEAVRQMLLCAMHVQHDADRDTKSITATASYELTDPGALVADGGPLDLALDGEVLLTKDYQGALSRVVHRVTVVAREREVGTVTVDTALRPDGAYRKLRMSHRETEPPGSDTIPHPAPSRPVDPHLVGRTRPENVVLDRLEPSGSGPATGARAVLHTPVGHASMFDHPQDHVPGPVMMEAARQLGLYLAGERFGLAPTRLYARAMRCSYARFGELDSDLVVEASIRADALEGMLGLAVEFAQNGGVVTTIDLDLVSTVGWTS